MANFEKEEFETSWQLTEESTEEPIKIESTDEKEVINEEVNIKPLEEVNIKALGEVKEKEVKEKEVNKEVNIEHVLYKRGKEILDKYKLDGIMVSNSIDGSTVIENWIDAIQVESANTDEKYKHNLIKSVLDYGYELPKPIQSITCGRIAKGGDIIVQAKAGYGKTAAFVFGSALRINPKEYISQVLILSPTQLLTDQTFKTAINLTAKTGITVHCHRGGLHNNYDKKTAHMIIGCPGRIIDLIKRGKINLNNLKTLILDEGDELLRLGFREQIKQIIEELNENVQICLFSATLAKGIIDLCDKFMREQSYVILPDNQVITELVSQWYVKCDSLSVKDGCLVDLIFANKEETIIVFFNSCSRLEKVSQILYKLNHPINHLCIHSKMDNSEERSDNIKKFTEGKVKVLLASDIASRGLDIHNITLVINYDIPASNDTYVHRVGRAGRGAFYGNAISLIMTDDDNRRVDSIRQIHGIPIKALDQAKMTIKSKY